MKRIIYFATILAFITACSTHKGVIKVVSHDENAEQDSVEYELETFDAKFETWYQLHDRPAQYRSQSYYEGWNKQYISAWNANILDSRKSWFFEPIVGYDPTVDYGFKLNHELFYYFQYVEQVLKISIMPGGPHIPL